MPKNFSGKIQGSNDALYQEKVIFEVLKCDRNIEGHNCAEEHEIDSFLKRIIPEIWINSE